MRRRRRQTAAAAVADDARTLARLFETHSPLVHARAMRLLKNPHDAQEATQEVFIRLLRNLSRLDTEGDVLPWLFRTTTNYCLNLMRDRSRRAALLDAHRRRSDGQAARQHDMVALRFLLSAADEAQARAAVYVYLDGMTYDETAEVMQVSRRTVANLLDRFRRWAAGQLRQVTA